MSVHLETTQEVKYAADLEGTVNYWGLLHTCRIRFTAGFRVLYLLLAMT